MSARVGPRLTVNQQVQLKEIRSKAAHPFRERALAVYILGPDKQLFDGDRSRAANLFPNGKLDLRAPVFSMKGVEVYFVTPEGRKRGISAFTHGMTPKQIDGELAEHDESENRAARSARAYHDYTKGQCGRIARGPIGGDGFGYDGHPRGSFGSPGPHEDHD